MRTAKSQVVSGLGLAGTIFLAFGTAIMLVLGIGVVFFPRATEPNSFLARHSPADGWVLLAAATLILVLGMHRWVKALAALLAYGTLNAFTAVLSGHLTGNAIPIARPEALLITVFFGVTAALSFRLRNRKLNIVDRIVLLLFVYCFAWAAVSPAKRDTFIMIGVTLPCLVFAWAYDRTQRRRAG